MTANLNVNSQKNANNSIYAFDNKSIALYAIYDNRRYHLIPVHQIVYMEAFGSYTKIHIVNSENKVIVYLKSIHLRAVQEQLENLASGVIIRCHRQYLVNTEWITAIEPGRRGGLISFRKPVNDVIPYSNKYVSFSKLLP